MAANSFMSARYTVVRATWEKSAPAAESRAPMLRITWSVWPEMPPSTSAPVAGLNPTWPEMKSRFPARIAGLSGPGGILASAAFACFRRAGHLGGLDDLARAQAAGADANPFHRAVDERPDRLQVRL